ncbi:MAG: RHS repeat-associated core domain-containing protein, partial [Acidobacteriota bacterium]
KKTFGGFTTYYVWEGAQVIAEYSNAPAGTGGSSYYLADRLSTRMTTDTNGAFKGTQDHLPFGEEGGTSGTSEKHRFTNYERDSESGTDYSVNRQYQMTNGRFMRPDPLNGSISSPQSLNRYSYVNNDPTNSIDPVGLAAEAVWTLYRGTYLGVGGGGFGGGADYAFWGDRIADLPGFGTMWGSLSEFYEGQWNARLQNTYDALAATYALNHGHPEIAAALMAANPTLVLVSTGVLGVQVRNKAWDLTVEALTPIAKALGGRIWVEPTTNITYIIDVHMSYTEVIDKLESIGLSYFWDPLPTHKGGTDYAANKAPWSHITVGYPYGEVTRYSFNRGGVLQYTEWGFRPDLTPPWITAHRDLTNPRDHWRDYIPWYFHPKR